jgi:hypothetical protein
MLQALSTSIRQVGIEYDILTFSDEPLSDVISCPLDPNIGLDTVQYLWKFHYLSKLRALDYDLFVFIDSDHYFVRKPPCDFSELLHGDQWHAFLESPLNASTTRRKDWWKVPNAEMVALWRDFGVKQKIVYNTNAGFFICKKEFIDHVCKVARLFDQHQKARGLNLTEETTVAVLCHLFSLDYTKRFHEFYMDYWASEWTGVLKDTIPNGEPWEFEEYMTFKKSMANPAIVHAMRSKDALVNAGKVIFDAATPNRKFITWDSILNTKS